MPLSRSANSGEEVGVSCFDTESKMAEQSAKRFTRFTVKYCLKPWQELQEDTSTDDICYSGYINLQTWTDASGALNVSFRKTICDLEFSEYLS